MSSKLCDASFARLSAGGASLAGRRWPPVRADSGPSDHALFAVSGTSLVVSGAPDPSVGATETTPSNELPQNTQRGAPMWFAFLHEGHSRPIAGMIAVGPIDALELPSDTPDEGPGSGVVSAPSGAEA